MPINYCIYNNFPSQVGPALASYLKQYLYISINCKYPSQVGPALASPSGPPGFFRCSDVEDGLAPSSAGLAWLGQPPSQALKNAPPAAFFTHAISAPLAPLRVRGASGQKNPTADAEKHRLLDRELFRLD
jgi:hypothetical protein